jgi:3-methyladenine DNA glycosylase AlkD
MNKINETMKYFLQNAELENTISQIKKKIRLSMNGVVSDKMKKSGIVYKQNFGVDIPRLKEIALVFEKNSDLAQRLWALEIRETMILATLLQPLDNFTTEMADEWLKTINQNEMVEQCCMNLFSKLPEAVDLCLNWSQSERLWSRITAFTLGARIWNQFNGENRETIIKEAISQSDTEEFHQYKSVALILSRIARQNKEVADDIVTKISYMEKTGKMSHKFIFNEVMEEISFLNF